MTGPATLRHAVIHGDSGREIAGRPALAWKLRELIRFGVERATILAAGSATEALLHAIDQLPRRLAVEFAEAPPLVAEPFLSCDGARLADVNVARLLSDFAADPPGAAGRRLFCGGAFTGIAACSAGADPCAPGDLPVTTAPGRVLDLADPHAALRVAALARRPALFLDRDGVLNRDHAYVGTKERWEWVDGALDAVRFASDHGWHVFVVTNQSGIARGYYTEAAARALLEWVADEARRHGGTIDDVRYCPYLPDAPVAEWRRDSDWRKPRPGMLLDLLRAWGLDAAECVMVGDRATDAEAAAAAGMRAHLFSGGNLLDFTRPLIEGVAKAPESRT